MEIFILDALLRPIDIVDQFVSFIWTERYAEKGDFQLVTLSTPSNRKRFVYDTMLMINESKRIMRVNTIEETIDEDNGSTLTIKGFELVSVLEQRIFALKETVGSDIGQIRPVSYFESGWTPIELPDFFVQTMCYPPCELSAGDAIPYLQPSGSIYPSGNLPAPAPVNFLWEQKVASLYSAVYDVCNAYDMGFRLYKDPNATKLYFETYLGIDRTSGQTIYPPVVFSSDMSNLENTTEYNDNTTEYNVIVAMYEFNNENDIPSSRHVIVSRPELALSSGGFDQKTKFITITQIPETMTLPQVPAYLEQIAQEELTRSRPTAIYDGEIDQNADFIYERDYYLGDLVEVRGNNGGGAYMRVVEQIIKEDANGVASYPSLVNKDSIMPGTWRSWKYDVNWKDMGSGEYWNNQ